MTLKNELRAALANSSSRSPIDIETLAKGHHRRHVEAALMEMYQDREAYWCQVTRDGKSAMLWWRVAAVSAAANFNYDGMAKANKDTPRTSTRMGDFSRKLLAHISANAGGTTKAYCDQLKLRKQADRTHASRSIHNLVRLGWLRAEGKNPGKRYFPARGGQ